MKFNIDTVNEVFESHFRDMNKELKSMNEEDTHALIDHVFDNLNNIIKKNPKEFLEMCFERGIKDSINKSFECLKEGQGDE